MATETYNQHEMARAKAEWYAQYDKNMDLLMEKAKSFLKDRKEQLQDPTYYAKILKIH